MSSKGDLHNLIRGIDSRLASIEGTATEVRKTEVAEEKAQRYLLIEIGDVQLAIGIESLVEVGTLPQVTYLPNLPSWIKGIVNIRSEIVSVIDFPGFLNLPEATGGQKMVVVKYQERKIGLKTNVVYGSVARPDSALKSLELHGGATIDTSLFRAGLVEGDRLHYVLDVRRLLTAPRLLEYNRSDL